MISEPQQRISERALTVWRISGVIHSLLIWLLGGGLIVLTVMFNWPLWIIGVVLLAASAYTYFFVKLVPELRWRRWRYEVREQEIELQHGVFIIKRTLVPMVRVQHVDTLQGPLLRKYSLANVTISTAATIHLIPGLDIEEADDLRQSISGLARVADDDV
ncbi:PH domain-containing protein [Bacillus sp. T33-2]|uniref:PH domain-containing protein n=1 Tax=Bacillus sp. T33-2 TaxID=2054168 RepID=UPI000C773134|nr:PH domain-containing protein [Bacillus sp. T33-2]PLR95557.1 hypothetical protein CVD19_14180 [Bacillus sp. T33-2]